MDEVETKLSLTDSSFHVVIVDDCSMDSTIEILKEWSFKSNRFTLEVIKLNYNVGHQNAIFAGLQYARQIEAKGYIVLDSDGEDDPNAIKELIKIEEFDIVFVTRGRRKESWKFKMGYFFYRLIFQIICGHKINFGNYSMISKNTLNAVCAQRYFHFSAFLSKLKYPKKHIQFDRQKRIDGKSKMNYSSLVYHGLKSLVEYSEEVLFFFLRMFLLFVVVLFALIGYLLYNKFVTHLAISGWASILGATLFNALLTIIGVVILSLFLLAIKGKTAEVNNYVKIK